MSKYTIGIDLGGTTMTAGLVNENYEIVAKTTWATRLPRPAEDLEKALADLCRTVAKENKVDFADVNYVGIGTPGSVNFKTGFVGFNTNFGYYDWNLGPDMEKMLGCIDWNKPAQSIHNLVRGVNPWPGAYTQMESGVLKVWKTALTEQKTDAPAGTIVKANGKEGLFVACGEGVLQIVEMQAPGSKRMNARDYLRGKPMQEGAVLGENHAESE